LEHNKSTKFIASIVADFTLPVIDRDKKSEEAILNFVQDGLDKEGI
jgi:hypothetical protein